MNSEYRYCVLLCLKMCIFLLSPPKLADGISTPDTLSSHVTNETDSIEIGNKHVTPEQAELPQDDQGMTQGMNNDGFHYLLLILKIL